MKKLIIAFGASLAMLAGCGGMSAPDTQATVLESGQHSAVDDVSQEFYHNQADFKAGWDKLYANESSKPAAPNVDFTKNTAIIFTLGQHKTGGYKARVIKTEAGQGMYTVGFEVTIPGIGCHSTTQEVTKPFIVVSVPTTSDITFDEAVQRRQPDCTAK